MWNALPEDQFELIPAAEAPLGIPAVRLTAKCGGVVGVFSLAHTETDQRVQCLAFTKEIIMPLEPEEMAICIAPDLPNVIEEVRHRPQPQPHPSPSHLILTRTRTLTRTRNPILTLTSPSPS